MENDSNKMDSLERELSLLAYTWRGLGPQDSEEASKVVRRYHEAFAELWELGWDGEGLLPDSELPDDLMPGYYLKRWRRS